MSAIPPAIISSAIQSDPMQRQQVADRGTEEARAAGVSRELTAPDKAVELEIEATDADTRVHTDAGGQGSYGRHYQEDDGGSGSHAADGKGISAEEGGCRIDIQA
jgi:hypothetical protein